MQKTGITELPLHYGHAPPWLFNRMIELGRLISKFIVLEYGEDEYLKRISNPFFFQSLCCVLGFDWHSSGTTTTVCGALKEAFNKEDIGIKIAGGKGKVSFDTPNEIEKISKIYDLDKEKFIYASRMSAKVDSAAVQDGYDLYHHCIFISRNGNWSVIQQGMNKNNNMARRYHWLSFEIKNFTLEPHSAICCDIKNNNTLDLTCNENKEIQNASLEILKEKNILKLPKSHEIKINQKIEKKLKELSEIQPKNYTELVEIKGVGASTLRALTLLSNIIYGTEIKWKDPEIYSFAHGGKDGHPFPIQRKEYDKSIQILKESLENIKSKKEKINALKRLENFLKI
ncbi:MAG: DUF763 domain-containing protein [Candidatus Aenigmatarchaeota archaeon]|nr:DUF763 domain-containing protein [Candidatus Aenigmarchaeota archaeon]